MVVMAGEGETDMQIAIFDMFVITYECLDNLVFLWSCWEGFESRILRAHCLNHCILTGWAHLMIFLVIRIRKNSSMQVT